MRQGSLANVVAAIASFFIPGLGQLVQGRLLAGLIFFGLSALFYALVVTIPVGLVFHIWSIVDAARFSPRRSK